MGDNTNTNASQKESNDPEVTKCDEPKTSIDVLRESKPSENIAIIDPDMKVSSTIHTVYKTDLETKDSPLQGQGSNSSHSRQDKPSESSMMGNTSAGALKNDEQKASIESTTSSSAGKESTGEAGSSSDRTTPSQDSAATNNSLEKKKANTDITEVSEREIGRTRSSVIAPEERMIPSSYSMPETESISTTIFSVSGAPSRKIYKRKEIPTMIFPVGCMGCKEEPPSNKVTQKSSESSNKIRPSSSTSLNRNPLTGLGVESHDEFKMKVNSRRGGNPVLGVGYDEPIQSSSTRIPPGGYSKGLW